MRHLSLFLLAASLAYAQVTISITSGPFVVEVGPQFILPYWESNQNGSKYLEWGLTASYGASAYHSGTYGSGFQTIHGYPITGLTPATLYHWRACSVQVSSGAACNTDPGTGNCACTADQTTTTLAAATTLEPTAPDVSSITTTKPTPLNATEWDLTAGGAGRTKTINSSCLDTFGNTLPTVLAALSTLNNGNQNLAIKVDPGCTYTGKLTFPARASHTGWVTFESSATAAQLPPDGVRTSDNFETYMPKILGNSLWGTAAGQGYATAFSTFGSYPTCRAGEYIFPSDFASQPGPFPLYVCNSGILAAQSAQNITGYSHPSGVITAVAHGYSTGELVVLAGSGVGPDGTVREITVINADTFTLNGWTSTNTWTSAGTVTRRATWRRISAITSLWAGTGTTLPSTCTERQVFYKSNVSPMNEAGYFCTSTNTWTNYHMRPLNLLDLNPGVNLAASANKYYFKNIYIGRVPGFATTVANDGQSPIVNKVGTIFHVPITATDITYDQVIVDGLDYPHRTGFAAQSFNGARIGFINSTVKNISWWSSISAFVGIYTEAYGLNMKEGPGPMLIENNYFSTHGITIFQQGGDLVNRQPKNILFRRNTIFKKREWLRGSAENTAASGMFFGNRHHFELKGGQIVLITGNRFINNWTGASDSNSGEMFLLTPTSETADTASQSTLTITSANNNVVTFAVTLNADWIANPTLMNVKLSGTSSGTHDGYFKVASVSGATMTIIGGPVGTSTGGTMRIVQSIAEVSDIRVKWNTWQNMPTFFSGLGFHNFSTAPTPTRMSKRWDISDNLILNLDFRQVASGGYIATGYGHWTTNGQSRAFSINQGVQGFRIANNVVDGLAATAFAPMMLYRDPSNATNAKLDGVVMTDNLLLATTTTTNFGMISGVTGDTGIANIFNSPRIITGNVLCCAVSTSQVANTVNNYPTLESDVGPYSRSLHQYRRRYDSLYRDRGPDMDALEAEQGLVSNARVLNITTSTATVSYMAPDATACTVEHSTSATWGTGTRTSDGGGSRFRNVALTGLTTKSPYYYRVLCAVEQPSGVYFTQ